MENELEFLENRIKADTKACEELRLKQENEKAAKYLRDIYTAYINEGFSEEQAFWIVAQLIEKAFKDS